MTDEDYVKKWIKSKNGSDLKVENRRLYDSIVRQLNDGCLISCDPMESMFKCCGSYKQIRFYVLEFSQVFSVCIICCSFSLQPAKCVK